MIALFPQAVKAWRTREVHDLSLRTFALLLMASALWITYGVLSGDAPVIATNFGLVGLNAAILMAKFRFD